MEGEYIQAALSLLKKAGRKDLVWQEALPALHPARKAAQGVEAALMACSPLRATPRPEQVRTQERGRGRAPAGKSGRVVSKAAGLRKGFLGFSITGRGGAGGGKVLAAKVRERRETRQFGGLPSSHEAKESLQRQDKDGEVQGVGAGGSAPTLALEELSLPQRAVSPSGEREGEVGPLEQDGEFDPLVPISRKWPNVLEWSSTESEGEEPVAVRVSERRNHLPLLHAAESHGASKVNGCHVEGMLCLGKGCGHWACSVALQRGSRGGRGGGGAPGFYSARVNDFAGTLDLCCQGERCGREEPGERRVARIPWREEQADPRAAGRSALPGVLVRRSLAADTPEERCRGMVFAPAGAAASWEQRPGPSGVHRVVSTRRIAGDKTGAWQQRTQAALGHNARKPYDERKSLVPASVRAGLLSTS
ncbi:hypothetical protein NDU88_002021 [Pleurodeles waltl]|uniref:Uncharacterized protein n=1 Tax=Pleurodeles waltl TaxID=8319 RepID=A0AAV7TLE8_PLEWA|nr:hypothetical protein NDU88_002021 [Pleurodeles waltl]